MRRTTTTIIFLGGLLVLAGTTRAGQEEQFTPEFKEAHTSYDPKHTPKIAAPDSVKRGQGFDVTVIVGSASARSLPPSSSAIVKVTLGAEKTGCRYTRAISAVSL